MWIPWVVSESEKLWQSPRDEKTPKINGILILMLSCWLGGSDFTEVSSGLVLSFICLVLPARHLTWQQWPRARWIVGLGAVHILRDIFLHAPIPMHDPWLFQGPTHHWRYPKWLFGRCTELHRTEKVQIQGHSDTDNIHILFCLKTPRGLRIWHKETRSKIYLGPLIMCCCDVVLNCYSIALPYTQGPSSVIFVKKMAHRCGV